MHWKHFFLAGWAKAQLLEQSIGHIIDEGVDAERLPALPCILHDGRTAGVDGLLDDVELTQTVDACVRVGRHAVGMFDRNVMQMPQPVVDESKGPLTQRRRNASATIVPANDNVFHVQHVHGILKDTEAIQVIVNDEVGDITVDEQLARKQTDDLVRRHPAVGASDPEIHRRLLMREAHEEFRIALQLVLGPGAVIPEQM